MIEGMSMIETKEVAADTSCGGMGRRIQHRLTIGFMTCKGAKGIRLRSRCKGCWGDFGRRTGDCAAMRLIHSMVLAKL